MLTAYEYALVVSYHMATVEHALVVVVCVTSVEDVYPMKICCVWLVI